MVNYSLLFGIIGGYIITLLQVQHYCIFVDNQKPSEALHDQQQWIGDGLKKQWIGDFVQQLLIAEVI